MIAATNIITRNACLRYSESMSEEMNPIFAKANAITGNLSYISNISHEL